MAQQEVVIPDRYINAWLERKVREIVVIERIEAKGKPHPELEELECTTCHELLVYQRGPFEHLSNGGILAVENMWAYRCDNPECSGSALIVLGDVRQELRARIKATQPIEVAPPAIG